MVGPGCVPNLSTLNFLTFLLVQRKKAESFTRQRVEDSAPSDYWQCDSKIMCCPSCGVPQPKKKTFVDLEFSLVVHALEVWDSRRPNIFGTFRTRRSTGLPKLIIPVNTCRRSEQPALVPKGQESSSSTRDGIFWSYEEQCRRRFRVCMGTFPTMGVHGSTSERQRSLCSFACDSSVV